MPLLENCPCCSAGLCEPHEGVCQIEPCLECGRQRVTCNCRRDTCTRAVWIGESDSSLGYNDRVATEKDVDLSLKLHQDRKLRMVPKRCWHNSHKVVTRHPDYRDAVYVEGYAVNPAGLLMEHGWLEKDGAVIDPTLPAKPYRYFAGLRIAGRDAVLETFRRIPKGPGTEKIPLLMRFGWGGDLHPGLRTAWREAMAHQRTLIARQAHAAG